MYCTKCGVAIDAGAKFCPACGAEQHYDAYGVSPAAMAATEMPANTYYTAVIGPKNQAYYLDKFERFDNAGKTGASWHWPAFFVSFYWFLYRKMWLPALAYFFAPYLLIMLAGVFAGAGGSNSAGSIGLLLYAAYLAGVWIVLPMYANALYYNHCKKKIAAVVAASPDQQRQLGELSARGGTSGIIIILVVLMVFVAGIGILAAIAIPAYQGYIARSQVAEALSLVDGMKVPVADYYGRNGACPGDNTAGPVDNIPVASSLGGTYVQMVQTSASPCAIIATMKSTGVVTALAGKTLVLQMQEDAGNLSWTCYSPDIKAQYLPKACREAPPQ